MCDERCCISNKYIHVYQFVSDNNELATMEFTSFEESS